MITADHGNAERMQGDDGQAWTAHTTNPVPLILVEGERRKVPGMGNSIRLREMVVLRISPDPASAPGSRQTCRDDRKHADRTDRDRCASNGSPSPTGLNHLPTRSGHDYNRPLLDLDRQRPASDPVVLLHSPKGDGMGGLAASGSSSFTSASSALRRR